MKKHMEDRNGEVTAIDPVNVKTLRLQVVDDEVVTLYEATLKKPIGVVYIVVCELNDGTVGRFTTTNTIEAWETFKEFVGSLNGE